MQHRMQGHQWKMKMKAGQSQDLKCPTSDGFDVIVVVTANITVFWGVIPYSLLPSYGHVGVWHHIRTLSYGATVHSPYLSSSHKRGKARDLKSDVTLKHMPLELVLLGILTMFTINSMFS